MVHIVVPIYKTGLDLYELYALDQCFSVLEKYPIVFVKPLSLDISPLTARYGNRFSVQSFDDEYFSDIQSYNRLMLSSEFYERFLAVDYILIYQTDALVFRDELEAWCTKGYDYIGAPWLPGMKYLKGVHRIARFVRRQLSTLTYAYPHPIRRDYCVGNGGLSLRKVARLYELTHELADVIAQYNSKSSEVAFNEDVFWGIEVKNQGKQIAIPTYQEALLFSIEMHPEAAFHLTNQHMPFGTHAWYKPPYDQFWRKHVNFEAINRLPD